jgi:hypothetical protein
MDDFEQTATGIVTKKNAKDKAPPTIPTITPAITMITERKCAQLLPQCFASSFKEYYVYEIIDLMMLSIMMRILI